MLPPSVPTRTPPPRAAPPSAARATVVAPAVGAEAASGTPPATTPGATVEGVVAGRDGAGHVLLRTEAGTLALATRLDLPRGARVVLRIDGGAPVAATVETVDGRPPAPPATSRPALPTSAPGTGEQSRLSTPAPTSRPAPRTASPTTSGDARAAPSPLAEAARPAVIPAPVVGAIVTATPVASPTSETAAAAPTPPATIPSPTSSSGPAPTSPEAPRASAGESRPAAVPVPAAASAPSIALRILAITPPAAPGVPTPPAAATPGEATVASVPAPAPIKAALAPAAPTDDGPRIPRPIFASPAKPAATPSVGAPASTSSSVAPGGGPKTAATPASAPPATPPPATPPATPTTTPTTTPRAETPPGAFSARVVGIDASGRPLVETSGGVLRLDLARPLDPGTRLLLAPVETEAEPPRPAPAATTALLGAGRDWPALRDVMDALRTIAPEAAREAMERAVAQPGARMAHTALFFLAALRGGDLAGWLGRDTLRRLDEQGRGDPVRRLAGDFAQLTRLGAQGQSTQGGHWQATMFPVFGGESFDRVRLFVRDNRDGDGADEDAGGTRFVVELGLSRLGELQLDGFLRERRFDLILRSRAALDDEARRDIATIFDDGLALAGLGGSLAFQTTESFPVSPLAEMLAEDRDGLVV